MPFQSDIEVGIHIGLNCTRAIKSYGHRTALDWGIIGVLNLENSVNDDDSDIVVN